jgi:hypothetical protein
MFIEMFRFPKNRRQPYKIFAFGAGRSLRIDLGQPIEVPDQLGYEILAEHSYYVRQVDPPKKTPAKRRKPKTPPAATKEMPEEQITVS